MGRAIETGNAQEALQYVDSDALATGVVEMAISVVKQEALTQIQGNQNNWETFGTALGVSLIDNLKEPLKNQLETQLTSEITKAASQKPSGVAFKLLTSDIKQEDNDSASIALQLPKNYQGPLPLDQKITLQLEKHNGRWQFVGLDKPTVEMLARTELRNQKSFSGEVEQFTYPDVASSSPQPQTESVAATNELEELTAEIASPSSIASSEVILTANDAKARINLRETPSEIGRYLGYGIVGDRVQAIDQTTSDGYVWYKVHFPKSGAQGWIRGDFVSQP